MIFNFPLNGVSFGHVSFNIAKAAFEAGRDYKLNNLYNTDLSSYEVSPEFGNYLSFAAKEFHKFSRYETCTKLWHIAGSESFPSEKRTLITFHELDELTDAEENVLANVDKTIVTTRFSQKNMERAGLNAVYCPLGYDTTHFKPIVTRRVEQAITFSLFGKFEKRKHTAKVIRNWCNVFGGNKDFRLNLFVFNGHTEARSPGANEAALQEVFRGQKPWNVAAFPPLPTLAGLNEAMNHTDIVLDMSGGESWSLPSFHTIGLGKHGVLLDATAMGEWGKDSGAVMVRPNGKEPVYDGMFFHKGHEFNQGNIFSWAAGDFEKACYEAVAKYKANPVNEKGLALRNYGWTEIVQEIYKD